MPKMQNLGTPLLWRPKAPRNGDLHLVYGCDKATEWGMVSFDNPHRGKRLAELRFRNLGEDWRAMVGTPYAWEHTDDAEGRVGPRDRETRELGGSRDQLLRNQTLFIQTINTTLREGDWQRIAGSGALIVCMDLEPSGSESSVAAAFQGSISEGSSYEAGGSFSLNQSRTTLNARPYPAHDIARHPLYVLPPLPCSIADSRFPAAKTTFSST